MERCKEAGERPAAFDEFGHSLQQIRKAVDLYHSKVDKVYIVSYILHTSLIILSFCDGLYFTCIWPGIFSQVCFPVNQNCFTGKFL